MQLSLTVEVGITAIIYGENNLGLTNTRTEYLSVKINVKFYVVCILKQGSYRSWKTWKVMEFKNFIFQACKVMEFKLFTV